LTARLSSRSNVPLLVQAKEKKCLKSS